MRMIKTLKTAVSASLFLAIFSLAACSDPISRENYAKIETGMSQDQVLAVLGEPDDFNSVELGELSGGTARWQGKTQSISVTFTNDKVAFKRIAEVEAESQ